MTQDNLEGIPEKLIAEQYELEMDMRDAGIQRYEKHVQRMRKMGTEEDTSYGSRISGLYIDPVATRISEWMEESRNKACRLNAAIPYLDLFGDMRIVAMIALKGILSQLMSNRARLSTTATKIGSMLQDELRCKSLREKDRRAYNGLLKAVQKKGEYKRKQWTARYILSKKEEMEFDEWPVNDSMRVGLALVERVNEVVGLIETYDQREKGKTRTYIRATEDTRNWVERNVKAVRELAPVLAPTIVPPKKWIPGVLEGGYYTSYVTPVPLVKTKHRKYLRELKNADMPKVLEGLNAAQETPWRINQKVLQLIEEVFKSDSELGDVPRATRYETPRRPHDIDTNPEALTEWKRAARRAHEDNVNLESQRRTYVLTLSMARKYSKYSKIFMPANLDFRGRVYFLPLLNPQGADYQKGLLEFGEGRRIGEEGIEWLMIHIAGLFGVDKVSFAERVAWTRAHLSDLLESAASPWVNRFWATADKPFQAYAACLELEGVMLHGAEHISRIPIAMDGSCSGLQHLSMAFRDSVGGRAVNLLPGQKPEDIYGIVAESSIEKLKGLALRNDDDSKYAQWWLDFGITRKQSKRNTMTYPYGSGQFGFADQIIEDHINPHLKKGHTLPEGFNINKLAQCLAATNYAAICSTVVKASEAMEWMQKAARMVAATGVPVGWVTPLGFPVVQNYRVETETKVDTSLAGRRKTLSVRQEGLKVDKRKSANAISPNVVHSLDSSHLLLLVRNAAVEHGFESFALIHDSFGVHPDRADKFFDIIRESLIELYTPDVFQDLHDQLIKQVPPENRDEFPAQPASGDLDIGIIAESLYCFA